MLTLQTDFNDLDGDRCFASVHQIRGAVFVANTLAPGDIIEVCDGEGVRCLAAITAIRLPIIDFRIDWSTFQWDAMVTGDLARPTVTTR